MTYYLPADEEDALRRILRHHRIPVTRELVDHLGQLITWVRQGEKAKGSFVRGKEPMPLLSLLGGLGIYGKEAIDKVEWTS